MYRFSRLLGQLYGAGISPIISLQLMSNSFSNFFYKKKALEIKSNLKAGFSFAESME
jgi:type II secretory pathway component PulF